MNDAIALLAISQVICLGGIAYLYTQLQALKARRPVRRPGLSPRVHSTGETPIVTRPPDARRQPRPAPNHRLPDAAELARLVAEGSLDVSALARRMRKSEEEVRLLLRRQGARR